MRLENDSMKLIQIILISDSDFKVQEVKRILLDFDSCPVDNNEYSVLVVWNDGRYKDLCGRIREVMDKINELEKIEVEPKITGNVWVVYGQRIKVDKNGICYKEGDNFPIIYLLVGTIVKPKVVRKYGNITVYEELFEFREIDSITVYTARGKDGKYFVVDASINVSPYLSKWLEFAQSGKSALSIEVDYGYDIISVPLPVNPDVGMVRTEVDIYYDVEIFPGILYPLIVAYPVYCKKGEESTIHYIEGDIEGMIRGGEIPLDCFIYLYDTIQFKRTPLVDPDQIDVKVVSLKDGSAIEAFVEND
ncbi:hypothetical protein, partial [Methanopyrus sp.]